MNIFSNHQELVRDLAMLARGIGKKSKGPLSNTTMYHTLLEQAIRYEENKTNRKKIG